jgi:hypothetical protein
MTPPEVEYRTIPLTQGQVAYVSPHRYDELSKFNWYAWQSKGNKRFYAVRHSKKVNGKSYRIYMHRQILGLNHGDRLTGDHDDRTRTLDNTDKNLRLANRNQQQYNQGKRRQNKSGYKGVCWSKVMKRYIAQICVNNIHMKLGYRDTAREAHFELYVPAARKYHGNFSTTQ